MPYKGKGIFVYTDEKLEIAAKDLREEVRGFINHLIEESEAPLDDKTYSLEAIRDDCIDAWLALQDK